MPSKGFGFFGPVLGSRSSSISMAHAPSQVTRIDRMCVAERRIATGRRLFARRQDDARYGLRARHPAHPPKRFLLILRAAHDPDRAVGDMAESLLGNLLRIGAGRQVVAESLHRGRRGEIEVEMHEVDPMLLELEPDGLAED